MYAATVWKLVSIKRSVGDSQRTGVGEEAGDIPLDLVLLRARREIQVIVGPLKRRVVPGHPPRIVRRVDLLEGAHWRANEVVGRDVLLGDADYAGVCRWDA